MNPSKNLLVSDAVRKSHVEKRITDSMDSLKKPTDITVANQSYEVAIVEKTSQTQITVDTKEEEKK